MVANRWQHNAHPSATQWGVLVTDFRLVTIQRHQALSDILQANTYSLRLISISYPIARCCGLVRPGIVNKQCQRLTTTLSRDANRPPRLSARDSVLDGVLYNRLQ
tara:strand:+ start:659 stop:973 length:315 start_codon:yes stop_codon:yes gene_type:complete